MCIYNVLTRFGQKYAQKYPSWTALGHSSGLSVALLVGLRRLGTTGRHAREIDARKIVRMKLTEVIRKVAPTVVALGSRLALSQAPTAPGFPSLIGTDLLVDSRGLVVANQHVVEELQKIPSPARFVMLFPEPISEGRTDTVRSCAVWTMLDIERFRYRWIDLS
jgi:S1-C subfamily serine protease